MLLMIDNYDSFTYNLVQYFGELGEDVRTYRNDEITLDEIAALKADRCCNASLEPCRFSASALAIKALARRSAAKWCAPSR
jgi:anthranilate synthase component 2